MDFEYYVDPTIYQVFILSCHTRMPVAFARHTWFVINRKGVLDRWELLFEKNSCPTSWDHLHKNVMKPFQPLGFFKTRGTPLWYSKLEEVIGGADMDSLAYRMIQFIEKTPETYKNNSRYNLFCPNSNTYVAWVLNHFPEFKIELPKRAVGKDYKVEL